MSVVSRSQTTAVGFDPVSLGGCSLWLDAADSNTLTLSGSNVIAWADKSGSNNSPTFGSNKPTYSATTRFVETSGLNQAFTVPGGIFNTVAGSIFMVFADKQENSSYGVFFGGAASYASNNFYSQSGLRPDGFSYALTGVDTPPAGFLAQINTRSMILYNQNYIYNSSNITAGINGTMYSMTSTFGNRVVTPSGGLGISGTTWGGQTNLRIYEILFYNSVLTTAQRQQIEGYLAWKWDLVVSPPDIGGLSLWLDAADSTTLTLSGSTVTQWRDKSGNGRHAAQVGTGPTRGSNAVVFSGSQVMSGSANYLHNSTNGTWSILSVFRPASLSVGNPRILNYQGTPNRVAQMLYIESGTLTTLSWLSGEASLVQAFGGSIVSNTTYIAGAVNTTSNLTAYRNGVAGTAVSHGAVTTISNGTYVLGGMAQGEDMFNGSMYEVIVYSNALTTTQRQQLESYLSRKWNVAVTPTAVRYPKLAATHPYQTTLPTYRDFSPLDFDGLSLWLDAADQNSLTLSGSNVSQWNDKSGNGRNTTTTFGTPTYSTAALNSRPAVSFNSTAFRGNFSYTGTQLHCFIVATIAQNGAFPRLLSLGDTTLTDFASPQTCIPFTINNGTANLRAIRNDTVVNAALPAFNTPFIGVSAQYANTQEISVNGQLVPTSGSTGTSAAFGITQYGIGIHTGIGGEQTLVGSIGEILVYGSYLSTTQRQEVEAYLARKWGLQSSVLAGTSHPYRYGPALVLPTQISGCALWLDAADSSTLTLSGSNVTAWADKSGNAYSAATYSGTITRTTQNGQGALNFGTGVMKIGSYGWPSYSSMFVVASTATGNFLIVQSRNDNEYLSFLYTGNWNLAQVFDGTSKLALNDSVIAQGTPIVGSNQLFMLGFGYNGGTASSFYTLNGSNRATTLVSGSGLSNVTTTGQPLYINGRWNTSLDNSVVCEILQFSRSLSSTERQQIEGYLAWKWGLQSNLPTSNHPFLFYKALTPTFTPLQISGLSLWLDAADATTLTLSGSNVTAWADKSGNGRTATPVGTVRTTTQNGLTAIDFDGTGSFNVSNYTWRSYSTTFWVARNFGILSHGSIAGGFYKNYILPANYFLYELSIAGTSGVLTLQDSVNALGTSVAPANAYYVFTIGYGGGTTPSVYAVNGTNRSTTVTGGSAKGDGTQTDLLQINGNVGGSGTGQICELLMYNSVLTQAQARQVEGYLAAKWGLRPSLPPSTNHPYRFGPWVGTPTSFSNCLLWLDATDVNATGSNPAVSTITSWKDKSSSGITLTSTVARTLSSNSLNGLAGVVFPNDGAGGGFRATLTNTVSSPPLLIVAVCSYTASSNAAAANMIVSCTGSDMNVCKANSNLQAYNTSGFIRSPNTLPTGPHIVSAVYDNSVAGIWRNGALEIQGSTGTGTQFSGTVGVGCYAGANDSPWSGSFHEILVFPANGTVQRQQIEGYLAWKWGLQGNLTSGGTAHPYKSFRP